MVAGFTATVVELMNCSMCLTNRSMLLSEMLLNLENGNRRQINYLI